MRGSMSSDGGTYVNPCRNTLWFHSFLYLQRSAINNMSDLELHHERANGVPLEKDEQELARMGYKQELK